MGALTVAGRTEVLVGEGLPDDVLPPREGRQRVAILTQPGATHYALDIARGLKEKGLGVEVIGLPDRDEAKSLTVAETVYETLARFGLGRQDTVVGVGGGSVSDLAGFVAGTWLRGVEVVHVPTTLLAAVDASIGGKTGVNLAGKNLVGLFWHPSRVVVDVGILRGLPSSLVREGMVEALKTGLVGDPDLFAMIERNGTKADLEDVVVRSATVKARVVGEDERELGIRAVLNLGHTIGHAIEFASPLSHGESVAIGLVAAARISEVRLGFEEAARISESIQKLGLPVKVTGLDRARVIDLLGHDKKRDAQGIRMVLLRSIGAPTVHHVDGNDIAVGLGAVGL
ncbi:MAG TPA: 3-dehydroquinate synthase [Acidimicrobiia bacterium]|nr:3-dehydroquinate synthase [Acidimicrobiia bacterium]